MCHTEHTAIATGEEERSRFVSSRHELKSYSGKPVSIDFDDIGMPSLEGYSVFCPRTVKECESDGEAWHAEANALEILGFRIVKFENAVIIFMLKK